MPGFGQVKAKRIQDAFNKPFRNSSTSVVPISSQIQFRASQQAAGSQADKGKGKEVVATNANSVAQRLANENLYRDANTLIYGDNKPSEDVIDKLVEKLNKEYVLSFPFSLSDNGY